MSCYIEIGLESENSKFVRSRVREEVEVKVQWLRTTRMFAVCSLIIDDWSHHTSILCEFCSCFCTTSTFINHHHNNNNLWNFQHNNNERHQNSMYRQFAITFNINLLLHRRRAKTMLHNSSDWVEEVEMWNFCRHRKQLEMFLTCEICTFDAINLILVGAKCKHDGRWNFMLFFSRLFLLHQMNERSW